MNFTRFPANTTNIFPIANSKNGGQLATEFNLRSRESVITDSDITYSVGPSFTHSMDDFAIRIQGDDNGTPVSSTVLEITAGRSVINGHYFESVVNVVVDIAEANTELVTEGQAPLKGKLAVGLRAMYSTEQTLAASMRIENSVGMNEGVQVVILPVGKVKSGYFVTPSDTPDNPNLVTAHLKLAEFDYVNGAIVPSSITQNKSKTAFIGADRIGDFDDLLIGTYVTRKGLNPKKLYTFSGKSVERGSSKDTWCDSTDSLFVWQRATDLTTTTESQLPQAEFHVGDDEAVTLTLPHKQVDDAMRNNAGDQLYYKPRIMKLPKADWANNTSGTITGDYTRNVKRVSERINELYSLPSGKQRGYLPRLEESRENELPTINQRTWKGGDYILVREDSTVMAPDSGIASAPSTIYPVLPPKVTKVAYTTTTTDGDIPEDLEGNEVNRVIQEYTATYGGSDSDSPDSVADTLSALTDHPENYMDILGLGEGSEASYYGNEGEDYMCVEVTRVPTVVEKSLYDSDKTHLPPLQKKHAMQSISQVNGLIKDSVRFMQDRGMSLAAACGLATYVYFVSGFEETYNADGGRYGIMAWPEKTYAADIEESVGLGWRTNLEGQLLYLMRRASAIYLDDSEDSPETLMDLLNSYPNSKDGARFAAYNALKYYTEDRSEDPYVGIRPSKEDAARFEKESSVMFDAISKDDLSQALPAIRYLVRNKFKKVSVETDGEDESAVQAFMDASDLPGNEAAACVMAAIAKVTSDLDPEHASKTRVGMYEWYGEDAKALKALDGWKTMEVQLDFLCDAPAEGDDHSLRSVPEAYDALIGLEVPQSMEKGLPECADLEALNACLVTVLTKYMKIKRSDLNEQKYAWVAEEYYNALRQMYSEATESLYATFRGYGLNHAAACGVCGSAVVVSMLDASLVSSKAHRSDGYGIMQWIGDSASTMVAAVGSNWASSVDGQAQWMLLDMKTNHPSLMNLLVTVENTLDGASMAAQAVCEDYLSFRCSDLSIGSDLAAPEKLYLRILMFDADMESTRVFRSVEFAKPDPGSIDSLPELQLKTILTTWRFYYLVTNTEGFKTYGDPLVVTGSVPMATESQIGGFYNIPDTQRDYGYVMRDEDGHLRLLDYDLLRTGVLAYQLGSDQDFGSGLSSEDIQMELSEYVNDRVAFPDVSKRSSDHPNMIEITLNTSEESVASEIVLENVDSRFGCGIWVHVRGKANDLTSIIIRNCEKVRVDIDGCTPIVDVEDSCLYYDAATIDYIRKCGRLHASETALVSADDRNRRIYPDSYTGLSGVSFWYERMDDLDPNLVVDGMTVYETQAPVMPEEIDYWSEEVSNDNHYFVGLESLTFADNGDLTGCGLYIRNDITANIELGRSIAVMSFELPQGANLEYPKSSVTSQIKVDGSFMTSYETANPEGYICMRTEFTALTQSGYRADTGLATTSDYTEAGMLSLLSDSFRVESVIGIDGTTPIDGWESNSYHIFRGRCIG